MTISQARAPSWWQPKPVTLPDRSTLVADTCKARVYHLLAECQQRGARWRIGTGKGAPLGPPGKVPTWVLRATWSGGQEGTKRLRELRSEHGVPIRKEVWIDPVTGDETKTFLYYLEPPEKKPKPLGQCVITLRQEGSVSGLMIDGRPQSLEDSWIWPPDPLPGEGEPEDCFVEVLRARCREKAHKSWMAARAVVVICPPILTPPWACDVWSYALRGLGAKVKTETSPC